MVSEERFIDRRRADMWAFRQRATASAIVCSLVIIAFISIGLLVMTAQFMGKKVDIPGEWLAAMLSLASTSLGFLAGEKRKNEESSSDNKCCQCRRKNLCEDTKVDNA